VLWISAVVLRKKASTYTYDWDEVMASWKTALEEEPTLTVEEQMLGLEEARKTFSLSLYGDSLKEEIKYRLDNFVKKSSADNKAVAHYADAMKELKPTMKEFQTLVDKGDAGIREFSKKVLSRADAYGEKSTILAYGITVINKPVSYYKESMRDLMEYKSRLTAYKKGVSKVAVLIPTTKGEAKTSVSEAITLTGTYIEDTHNKTYERLTAAMKEGSKAYEQFMKKAIDKVKRSNLSEKDASKFKAAISKLTTAYTAEYRIAADILKNRAYTTKTVVNNLDTLKKKLRP
jgi:uncharacterized protein YukE